MLKGNSLRLPFVEGVHHIGITWNISDSHFRKAEMALSCQATIPSRSRAAFANSGACTEERNNISCSKVFMISNLRQPAPLASKHSTFRYRLERKRSGSLLYVSSHGTRLPVVLSQMVQFQSTRAVSIPFKESSSAAQDYLKEVERVVRVTFPDSARITNLGDSVWRARLKPITFISITGTPLCDIRVSNEDNALCIFSDKLFLDLTGVPDQFKNLYINFQLKGSLRAVPQDSQIGGVKFDGSVVLKLGTDLPLPFSLLPEALLTGAGNGILDTILGAMESALLRGIIDDYYSWCKIKQGTEFVRSK